MTSKNATHRTQRSPSLFHHGPTSFFFPPTILMNFSSISPLSAWKLVLLACLTQNAKLISELWTIANPVSYLTLCKCLRRKELGYQGAQELLSCGSCFFKPRNTCTFFMWTSWHPVSRYKLFLNRTQKTAVLIQFYYYFFYDFGGKCERADFYFFCSFWKLDWWNCRTKWMITLDTHHTGKFSKPKHNLKGHRFYYTFSCPLEGLK